MKLKEIVAGLVMTAEGSGKEHEKQLEHGLIVCVSVGKKTTRLKLKRKGSQPSVIEWNTVVDVWPYPVGPIAPESSEENGYGILQASWPTQGRLFDAGC